MYKVCYVEDQKELNNIVTKYLKNANYDVYSYNYPKEINFEISYDLYVLDIMFDNDINGYELLKKIRQIQPNSIIIYTSARDSDVDRIKGLELGSNDYLSKPFSPKELVLRCNLLLNRYNNKIITQNNYRIDLDKKIVYENNSTILLTNKEYEFINLLINNKNKIIKRTDIYQALWKDEVNNLRVVDDLVRRLRGKMPNLSLETIYGEGYLLV